MKPCLEFSGDKEGGTPFVLGFERGSPDILNVFQESVQKSIAMVESPHARNAQEAAAETKVIKGADNVINSLTPRA